MQHAAAGGLLEAGDHAQRRGLAAARRAEQGEELAGLDVEVDPGHRHLVGVALLQALERDGPTARQLAGAAAVAHWRCSSARGT